MRKMIIFIKILILVLVCFTVSAEAFRCKNEPIGRWDTKNKVLKYCGKPMQKGYEKVFYKGSYIYAETWYYNCGEDDFIYAVTFYDDIVIKDDSKNRGNGKGQCR